MLAGVMKPFTTFTEVIGSSKCKSLDITEAGIITGQSGQITKYYARYR